MGTDEEVRKEVQKYSDMLYKICIVILCNEQDVQDAIQDTFCRYMEKKPIFRDEQHEKAWLIRVAVNISRDMIRFRIRHPKVSIEELENSLAAPEQKETLRELLELPVRQKMVIYLHYVEGYRISDMVQSKPTEADTFSREYSDSEEERRKAFWQAYKDGTFPETAIVQVEDAQDVPEGTLCYVRSTGVFHLPDREMTDEEILEIIDFQHKMSYAVSQTPAAQEARAQVQAEKERLREMIRAASPCRFHFPV